MKNGYKLGLAAIAASISLVGCGGGDESTNDSTTTSSTKVTGTSYYVDSPVSGVNYTCGTLEGITLTDGAFTFDVGSSCTFSLGDIVLRSVDAGLLVDGESVYETNLTIARILQSADSDHDASNGITIDTAIVEALRTEGITDTTDMDALLTVIVANGGTVVSEIDAQAHLDEEKLKRLLPGKTFDIGSGETLVFNDTLTSVTFPTGQTGTLSLVDEKLIVVDNGGFSPVPNGAYFVFQNELSNNSLVFNIYTSADVFDTELIFAEILEITQSDLTGKTFYFQDIETNTNYVKIKDVYGKITFAANEITLKEIYVDVNTKAEEVGNATLPYTLVDGTLIIDLSMFDDGFMSNTLASKTPEKWSLNTAKDQNKDGVIDQNSDGTDTWFFSKPALFPASL